MINAKTLIRDLKKAGINVGLRDLRKQGYIRKVATRRTFCIGCGRRIQKGEEMMEREGKALHFYCLERRLINEAIMERR